MMIRYMGCKKGIAKQLLNAIPSAVHFYDLFGGGGSMTESAYESKCVLKDWSGGVVKWDYIHYNDINQGVYLLNKEIWEGVFDFEKAYNTWISKDIFLETKDEPTSWGAFVKFIWSFNQQGKNYIYCEKLELEKLLLHFFIKSNEIMPGLSRYEKQSRFTELFSVFCLQNGLADYNESKCGQKRKDNLKMRNYCYTSSTLIKSEHLTKIEQIKNSPKLDLNRLSMTCKDYRDVEILPDSVVYCDIPYNTPVGVRKNSYDVKFDFEIFYDWAATRNFPVFISEYECVDSRFKTVLEVPKIKGGNAGGNKSGVEKLFWNGKNLREEKT